MNETNKPFYNVSGYEITVNTDQNGPITVRRWRITQSNDPDSTVQQIVRAGFTSKADAEAYLDKLYDSEKNN